eukprot:225697-Chlamydomonas_euryale.AAC.1
MRDVGALGAECGAHVARKACGAHRYGVAGAERARCGQVWTGCARYVASAMLSEQAWICDTCGMRDMCDTGEPCFVWSKGTGRWPDLLLLGA